MRTVCMALEASNIAALARHSHNPPTVLCVVTGLVRRFSALKAESAACHSFYVHQYRTLVAVIHIPPSAAAYFALHSLRSPFYNAERR